MRKYKPTGQPKGRPRLNLPVRQRHFLQVERTPEVDSNLIKAMTIVAELKGLPASAISQSEAIRIALSYYTLTARLIANEGGKLCPRCNGLGYLDIRNGDDDEICECCGQDINASEIPF